MNIAIVTHCVVRGDGQGRVNLEIARAALSEGHRVWLVAGDVDEEIRSHPLATWVPVRVPGLPTSLVRDQFFSHRSARWIRRQRGEMDVVHANGFDTWTGSTINTVHFVHSAYLKSPVHAWRVLHNAYGAYQWAYTRLNSSLERWAFKRTRCVVAVSQVVREQLLEAGVPAEKVRVILNGVDTSEFAPAEVSRSALGLPEGVTLGLFAGAIRTPRKNLDTVLQALVRTPDIHLAVAGSTQGSPFPATAERLGVSSRVHFLGFRRDIADLMKAVDFFAFPSRYEACSLVLLEALASGLPVITAGTAGGAEVVSPDCGVVLEQPDDVDRLAAAMRRLADDAPRRQGMARAARQVALKHTWEIMGRQYLELYREFASSPEPAAAGSV